MSQDEIVFDDVKYREPERMCRPDRDRRFASLAYEVPGPDDLPIFLNLRTADAIERHALRDTGVELGGILLGKECVDDRTGAPFVFVTESLEAKHFENTQASFTYTHDSWEEISRERDRLHPGLDIVGWYHTHPDFGIFLSGHDVFIHQHFFAQPLQVAYVVDPIRQTRGFFQWRGGNLAQVGGYFITTGRGERNALARFVNDLESIQNTEGGGGGLSPRLEAELMAMLTRPAPAQTSSAERTMAATMFGLLGVMAGAIGVCAVLWLTQLHRSVQEQSARIGAMAEGVERATSAQRLALEALLSSSGDKNADPNLLVSQYDRTVRELDDARHKLERQMTVNDSLAERARTLAVTKETLITDLGVVREVAKKYEKDAKEASTLRDKVDTLEADNNRQAARIVEQEEVLETATGQKAIRMMRRYDRAWYAAVAGWVCSLVLALGLLVAFGLKPLAGPEDPPSPPSGGPIAGIEPMPPHHIT